VILEHKDNLTRLSKASLVFIGMIALYAVLYWAQGIIVPIIFSTIIAIVLHPVVNLFVRFKINRVVAISVTLFMAIIVLSVIGTLLFSQFSKLIESWPFLVDKFTEVFNEGIIWFSGYFDINPGKFHAWIAQSKNEMINSGLSSIGQTIVTVSGWFVALVLVPVYIFLILYYQPLILDFIHKLFSSHQQHRLGEMITQSKAVVQSYLIGLFAEFVIIGILYTMTFLILGIEYAILFGVIGGLLNVIRYIGPFFALLIFMAFALITKSPAHVFYILLFHMFVQIIDNFFIVPLVVASRVKINALFSIIAMIAGYALWGIAGMFLSIPLLAIIKLVFDKIEPLKPWGFLLGDTMPPIIKIDPVLKGIKRLRR
jgi:predicted PurR-regulated permease PerM